ncbi:SGNH/GDSL hydrolase family protein [Neobacillus sp. NRS-1170]|uniref:SGNH/GDSL hydrolase family protein n=1 Tax=Neobacillus sp. NRS-1170 TaxID=3233898 RepID=UPI003D2B969F
MSKKKVIACLGDSMTAFWGTEMRELKESLSTAFSDLEFELLNYGVSGTRAEYGKYRITHDYPNPFKEGNMKCLSAVSPDLVIVESFAYNHRLDGGHQILNYQNELRLLVQTINETTPAKIIFLVTIPPDKENFLGNIPTYNDVNVELRREWAEYSDRYLKAALDFAKKEGLPLANVYERVQQEVNQGTPIQWFIDQNDTIHPSRYAYLITASEIVNTIEKYQLLTSNEK